MAQRILLRLRGLHADGRIPRRPVKPILLAEREKVAILCVETVPWRCHRSLIADALTSAGISVINILDADHSSPHQVTPFARIHGVQITYPDPDAVEKTESSTI